MQVVAFDTAISTGCAVGEAGGTPQAFTVSLGKSLSWDQRFARLLDVVDRCIDRYKPDLIAVEAPVGGRTANADLIGLTVCVRAQAARRGVRCVSYFPASVRKHLLGQGFGKGGKAIKSLVAEHCRTLGWVVEDTDQADAMALWEYACAKESPAHQVANLGGLFARVKA